MGRQADPHLLLLARLRLWRRSSFASLPLGCARGADPAGGARPLNFIAATAFTARSNES